MRKMKLALMIVALAAISVESLAAMSLSDIRREARFLSDRMGHELGLSNRQYEDVYEINFDFLYQVNEVIDDMVYGYDDAIDYYYYLLDVRNEDLMYVLRKNQYRKFVKRDYFYRPIYMAGGSWQMRIWKQYVDRNYFYFGAPACYHSYNGAHYRIHFAHSYYANMYHHALFDGAFRLWGVGCDHRHHDGWHSAGKNKPAGSRPWSNAKNYEKSSRDLRAGFVSVPSRDENKRVVKVDSEENHRSAMSSSASSRSGSSSSSAASAASSRSSSASASSVRSSSASASSARSSAASVSASSSRSSGSSSSNSGVSRSSNSSSSSRSSASSSSGSSSGRSSSSSSRSSSSNSGARNGSR